MRNKITAVVALVLLATAGFARAAEDGWQFKLTPYLWAMGVDGDVGVGPVSVPVDVKFSDAVQDLDLGGMLSAEATHGPWGILFDGSYLKLSDDAYTHLGKFVVEFEQWMLQGSAVYRAVNAEKTAMDLGLGGRYMSLDTTIETPSSAADLNESKGLMDPVVVARVRQQFTEKLYGVMYGDLGGFGVASDLTWQLMAAAGYSFTKDVSLLVGYRYLDYDYEKDAFSFDAAESGLAIGVQIGL
jgi:predicted porin